MGHDEEREKIFSSLVTLLICATYYSRKPQTGRFKRTLSVLEAGIKELIDLVRAS